MVTHADAATIAYTTDSANIFAPFRTNAHNTQYNYAYIREPVSPRVTQTLSTATGGQIVTAYAYDIHGNLPQ